MHRGYGCRMRVVSVPYFIGQKMSGFVVPDPDVVLEPALPGDPDADYPTSTTAGPGQLAQHRLVTLNRVLAAEVAGGGPCVVYAGDCLAAIGVLAGLQQKGIIPTLYWFDAHGDFNTWDTTPSGFLGGMPLAMLTGRGERTLVEGVGLAPLADDRVVLVDGRDLDPGEREAVAESSMRVCPVGEVATGEPSSGPLYVHVDVDVVDPRDLPAVNYPAGDGPGLEAVAAAVRRLAATGRVVAVSISSWNPALPGSGRAAVATRRITEVFLPARLT